MLAWAGLLVGILRRQRLALYLAALAAAAAGAYRWMPQGVLWNARILPFYYVLMLLLAAVGVAILLTTLVAGGPLGDVSEPRGDAEPAGERGRRRSSLPAGSLRLRIAVAAVIPLGAVAVAVDDLAADSSALRALLRILPGIERATASQRAGEVAHLALLILLGAALVALVELLRSLRGQGFRPKERGLVVLRAQPPEGATGRSWGSGVGLDPAGTGAARPPGAIRPLGRGEAGDPRRSGSDACHRCGGSDRGGGRGLPVAGTGALPGAKAPTVATACAWPRTSSWPEPPRRSFLPFWVYWNFSGYESKQPNDGGGGYEEYYRVVTTMARVAEDRGCGRVMWE